MAIDDNTLYGLTGAQVKDLAGKVEAKADSSSLATVATSGSYNDLSNKPTIPTVNNATLTIQKNGTTVKTFTANASSNVTANITVPTKTSDLTNDSSYVTTTAMNTALADKADNSDIPTALSELTNDINAVSDSNYVHTDNNYTTAEKNKLSGIASGAEVNQNAFSNVKVGSTTVAADSKTDTLELVAGNNITLTPDATNDKVTVTGKQQTRTNDNLSPSSDTTAGWSSLFNTPSSTGVDHTKGPFVTYYNTQNCFSNQPSQYGFLETFVTGGSANIIQRWTNLVDGITLLRSGNQSGWYRANSNGGWERFSYGNQSTFYVESTTAAGTAAKTANFVSGLNGKFKLETGVRVSVKFTNGNTYNGTATLNVDGTGATNIVYAGTSTGTRYMWSAGEVVDFIYDGTNWVMVDGGLATTTYYGVTKLSDSIGSTSTSMAATPSSVKQAYDLANTKSIITMTGTDPGEGSALATNNYVGVYDDSAELVFIGDVLSTPSDVAYVDTANIANGAVTEEKLGLSYSTSEQSTGMTWIDGKTIYKKTIDCGKVSDGQLKTIDTGVSGIDKMVKFEGVSIADADNWYAPFPQSYTNNGIMFSGAVVNARYSKSSNQINIFQSGGFAEQNIILTIYYTKSS